MKKFTIYPPTCFWISILVMAGLHFALPIQHVFHYPVNMLGLFPITFGMIIVLLADQLCKLNKTTVKPDEYSSSMVMKWPFSMSRNPMYLGMTMILFGIAILFGSISTIIIPLLFALIMDVVYIRNEERLLKEKFGSQYIFYKNKVRKWI